MTNYTPCEYEHRISPHLSTCKRTDGARCEYLKFYNGNPIRYCRKQKRIADAILEFANGRDKIAERAQRREDAKHAELGDGV